MGDYDSRIVALYDEDNPDGPDHDFYRTLAARAGARSIVDLGCGTGILTVTLAAPGRRVVGIDPSMAMLGYARQRPGAEAVEWRHGDGGLVEQGAFDLALMTGNVAQHIPDGAWERTLADLRRGLQTGGLLAFESRNPAARAWEQWTTDAPTTRSTASGELQEWSTAEETAPGVVRLTSSTRFVETDEVVTEELLLTFRAREAIEGALVKAGFAVDSVAGDWSGRPFQADNRLLIVVARAG